MAFRLAVLVSGSGSNLQAIIDKLHTAPPSVERAAVEVGLVISNVPGVLALDRARAADIPTAVFRLEDYADRGSRDLAMADAIVAAGCELVVLAGYMHILTPEFLERFPYRIINLHPALLPSFPGTHAIDDAISYGVKVTGVTVHFVDEGMDSGPVIAQRPIAVFDDDTVDSLADRIHAAEHVVLPEVVEMIAGGSVMPPGPGSRCVRTGSGSVSLGFTTTE
ncbi:MAG: phosphoribosylglycinamide formyltransferase [Gaiellales bacterium]|nr:phosphoribosylglycinamide formyltransferase [Gaiellales bacterium]